MTTWSAVRSALPLVVGALAAAVEPVPSDSERRRSFIPSGWEVGDCPPAYGADSVLCGGTDVGRWKVDRHTPTVWIRAPKASCAEAEKALVARWEGTMRVARRTTGRCGPAGAPCTEIRFKDSRAVDPSAPLAYLVCPPEGPVEIVSYVVSARVIDAFEPVARAQARWTPRR